MGTRRKTAIQGKVLQHDYDYVLSKSTTNHCYSLTNQHRAILLALLDYVQWRSRWKSGTGQAISQDVIDALHDDLANRLINPVQCGDAIADEECFTYLPDSPFIEWFPNDPFTQPDLITEGYNLPAWYVANQAEKTVQTDIGRFPPGSLPGIIPASGLPRFRLHVQSESGGIVEIHLYSIVGGSICQITIDDDPLSVRFVELDTDITSAPPETVTDVIVEVEIEQGVHHIDCIIVSQVNESIPFIHHGGGLKSVVLCGVGVGESMIVPQFRFLDCALEYSLDAGVSWLPVDGWETYAPGCFTGETGAPGADGEDGCSPSVWIETRPADGHKILWIDADCDEVNDYEVDLTAENQTPASYDFLCRFVRSVVPELARVIVEAEAGALPGWDLELMKTAFVVTFQNNGLLQPVAPSPAWDAVTEQLFALGYQYNADLSDSLQNELTHILPMRDLYYGLGKPELDNDVMLTYYPYVQNQLNFTPVQMWISNFIFALWAEDKRLLEAWAWDMMAHPAAGDCIDLNEEPPVYFWTHQFSFTSGLQGWTLVQGVENIGIDGEYDGVSEYKLLMQRAISGGFTLIGADITGSLGNFAALALQFKEANDPNWREIVRIETPEESATAMIPSPYYQPELLQINGDAHSEPSHVTIFNLVIYGIGINPFV